MSEGGTKKEETTTAMLKWVALDKPPEFRKRFEVGRVL